MPICVVFHEMARISNDDHEQRVRALQTRFAGRVQCISLRHDAAPDLIQRAYQAADVLVTRRLSSSAPSLPSLRLLQVPASGYDLIDLSRLPVECTLCNLDSHEIPIAEYALAAMLEWNIGFSKIARSFQAGIWIHGSAVGSRPHRELYGRTLSLLGFGHIGSAIAARAKAFGMKIEVMTRARPNLASGIDRWFALEERDVFLGRGDFLVLACPLTEMTRGLVNAAFLNALQPMAVLLNLARAEIINDVDLFEALRTRRIGGAILDVWWNYPDRLNAHPRPSSLPFHELDNVMMTPHIASWTDGLIDRRWEGICRNLEKYLSQAPLENIVSTCSGPRDVRGLPFSYTKN